MKIKDKSWIWKLTWPFAHDNYTIVFGTLYKPKGRTPSKDLLRHEEIHCEQAKRVGGWLIYYFLYLFCLPFLWNPFRKKWETEAYRDGSKWSEKQTKEILRSSMYGWIIF